MTGHPMPERAAWRPVFHASVEALDAARRYLSCPTPSRRRRERGLFLGHNVKRTFGGDGRLSAEGPFLLGLLRADLGPLPVHGRGRRRARRVRGRARARRASGSSACRCLPGTSDPGGADVRPPVLEAHTRGASPTRRSPSRAPPTALRRLAPRRLVPDPPRGWLAVDGVC